MEPESFDVEKLFISNNGYKGFLDFEYDGPS